MSDNQEALKHLNKYELCKYPHAAFVITGLFSIIEGIIMSAKQTRQKQDEYNKQFKAGKKLVDDRPGISLKPSLIGLGTGIGCFIIAGRFTICKQKQLKKAIDIYNQ